MMQNPLKHRDCQSICQKVVGSNPDAKNYSREVSVKVYFEICK